MELSIIIVNWNSADLLTECMASIREYTKGIAFEVIIVDNASTDHSTGLVRERFPEYQLIVNEKNLGFGGGNNVGICASQGKYIMMLNNDTRLDPKCIEELKRSIEKDKSYGVCASKILLESAPDVIDGVGILVCPDGLSFGRGRLEKRDRYDKEEELFFAADCACLYRREMLEDIGLYDEDFFAYADETDMGWRAQLAGWKCTYSPNAIVYHLHSVSSGGRVSSFKAFLVERNRIWVAVKNFPISLILLGQFYTLWRYLFQAYGALRGRGAAGRFTSDFSKAELVKILLKAYLSAARKFPLMLKKRKMIQKKKRISNREVYRLIKRYGISAREIALSE